VSGTAGAKPARFAGVRVCIAVTSLGLLAFFASFPVFFIAGSTAAIVTLMSGFTPAVAGVIGITVILIRNESKAKSLVYNHLES
jgi:hypothetical protein